MNNFFSPCLPYAETHYKFKLPWSPLYKRWPEVFIDGPSFCIPGINPRFYLVLKDADFFPVTIREIDILIQGEGQTRKQVLSLDRRVNENLIFIPLDLDFTGLSGEATLNGKITIENSKGKSLGFLNANFPGLPPAPLKIHLLSHALPYPANWYGGELHCHSDYSNDPVEYGAPLHVLQQAGQCLGLGYVVCTDHSYDFYYRKTRYMEATDPDRNFQAYREEALALNHSAQEGSPVMIPGEEVSCGNLKGENVHLLVAGHEDFLPGLGDGGRRWLNNKPDLRIEEVLERIGETPCFAAHPRVRVGSLERFIFRRGMWDVGDLKPSPAIRGVNGLQFWNGTRKSDFTEGRDFWISQLLEGKRLSPIGANDAHGDLNRNIGVKTPLFSLYQNRNHVFGNVRTVVQSDKKTVAGIQAGLRSGKLFCTDGPFLALSREASKGRIEARSTEDFGGMEKVMLLAGRKGESKEFSMQEWKWNKDGPMHFSEPFDFPAGIAYIRAEGLTSRKRFALASPLFSD